MMWYNCGQIIATSPYLKVAKEGKFPIFRGNLGWWEILLFAQIRCHKVSQLGKLFANSTEPQDMESSFVPSQKFRKPAVDWRRLGEQLGKPKGNILVVWVMGDDSYGHPTLFGKHTHTWMISIHNMEIPLFENLYIRWDAMWCCFFWRFWLSLYRSPLDDGIASVSWRIFLGEGGW